MKTSIKLLYLILIALALLQGCKDEKKTALNEDFQKLDLKVLYVGYNPSRAMPDFGDRPPNSATPERYTALYKTRMTEFQSLLQKYLAEVDTIDARNYEAKISDNYDVTIFDAVPKAIAPAIREYDGNGKLTKYERAKYLPDNFSKPTIFISSTAPIIGDRLGLKLDWLCLCLDSYAHHTKDEHPIFLQPLKVDLSMELKETPKDIYHYASGQDIPKQIPMWQVQTEGYKDGKGYMIGMVSRGRGFLDSPDTEFISSGVNTKDVSAVALGRHGNFFLWGFSGSPNYMTEQAKKVFINTIAYMKGFDGDTPMVRKRYAKIRIRPTVEEQMFWMSKTYHEKSLESAKAFNVKRQVELDSIKVKQEQGIELSRKDKSILKAGLSKMSTHEELVKRKHPELYKTYGMDFSMYQAHFEATTPYFHPGADGGLVVDEQAKKLGIANNDKAILDTCITMLESGKNKKLAQDVLQRYTNENFEEASSWRSWYTKNKDLLFFTEAGCYKFMVNTLKAAGENKTVSQNDVPLKDIESKIEQTYSKLACATPTRMDPVQMKAEAVKDAAGNLLAVVMKVDILEGWHLYSYVPENEPYIETSVKLESENCTKSTEDWIEPDPSNHPENPDIFIYKDQVKFVYMNKDTSCISKNLTVSLNYQACDDKQCLPPDVKKMALTI